MGVISAAIDIEDGKDGMLRIVPNPRLRVVGWGAVAQVTLQRRGVNTRDDCIVCSLIDRWMSKL